MLQVFLANVPNRKHCKICSFHDGTLDVWNNFGHFWLNWSCHNHHASSIYVMASLAWKVSLFIAGTFCEASRRWLLEGLKKGLDAVSNISDRACFVDSVFFYSVKQQNRTMFVYFNILPWGSTSVAYLFLPFTSFLQLCRLPLWEGDLKPWNSIFFPLPEVETVTNPASPCIKFAL